MFATNRQKKLLRFFSVKFSPNISSGAAGWEIDAILESEENRDLWRRYLYNTSDFDSDTDELRPHNLADLRSVNIPEEWDASNAMAHFRDEIVAGEMTDGSPFDSPQPPVSFQGKQFIFTGKFSYGSRKACQTEVIERGGLAPSRKSVNQEIDYLVIGTEGSKDWKRGSYGNKIEAAILSRRTHGSPAIISEEHWTNYLTNG